MTSSTDDKSGCSVEKSELVEFILPVLCVFCQKVPPANVYHCSNNHIVCEECRDRQEVPTKCSICKTNAVLSDSSNEDSLSFRFKLIGTDVNNTSNDSMDATDLDYHSCHYTESDENLERDYQEEIFLDKMSFECTYADNGCQSVYSRSEIYEHIANCNLQSMCLRFGFHCKDCKAKYKVRNDLLYRVTQKPRTVTGQESNIDSINENDNNNNITLDELKDESQPNQSN